MKTFFLLTEFDLESGNQELVKTDEGVAYEANSYEEAMKQGIALGIVFQVQKVNDSRGEGIAPEPEEEDQE